MKKFFFVLSATTALTILFACQAQAAPKGGPGPAKANLNNAKFVGNNLIKANLNLSKNYYLKNATKFAGGYCFKGKNHCHWSICRFDARYGCNCYFDPCLCVWFYWCQPDLCYYPVTYCPYRIYCWQPVVQPVVIQPVLVQTYIPVTFVRLAVVPFVPVATVAPVGIAEPTIPTQLVK